jgi:hypothetical protein
MDTAEKIGRKLHRIIVTSYQKTWHQRCDKMKTRKLLFNDRMKVFPTQKPVQDLTEDDYIFFAEAWANLQEQRCIPSKISNDDSLHTRPTKKARCERTTGHDGQLPIQIRTEDSAGSARG